MAFCSYKSFISLHYRERCAELSSSYNECFTDSDWKLTSSPVLKAGSCWALTIYNPPKGSIQFCFNCIALFTMDIGTKQLHRKLRCRFELRAGCSERKNSLRRKSGGKLKRLGEGHCVFNPLTRLQLLTQVFFYTFIAISVFERSMFSPSFLRTSSNLIKVEFLFFPHLIQWSVLQKEQAVNVSWSQ